MRFSAKHHFCDKCGLPAFTRCSHARGLMGLGANGQVMIDSAQMISFTEMYLAVRCARIPAL